MSAVAPIWVNAPMGGGETDETRAGRRQPVTGHGEYDDKKKDGEGQAVEKTHLGGADCADGPGQGTLHGGCAPSALPPRSALRGSITM